MRDIIGGLIAVVTSGILFSFIALFVMGLLFLLMLL